MAAKARLVIEALASDLFGPVSMQAACGECIAIRGPSGAGKSLFLRALADLDVARGRVHLDGVERNAMPASRWRTKVALVPAQPGWWADRVGDHFAEASNADLPALLHQVGLPEDAVDWSLDRLSTGEAQRVALVRALIQKPEVLLLDEPTSSLDLEATEKVEAVIKRQCEAGVVVLLVTHDPGQAVRMASRRYVLEHGTLRSDEDE